MSPQLKRFEIMHRLSGELLCTGVAVSFREFVEERARQRAGLSNADFSGAHLSGVNLSEADVLWANLSGTDLSGANLSYADFSGADFSDTDLSGADLSGTDLSGADLRRAKNITARQLKFASTDSKTKLPPNLESSQPQGTGKAGGHISRTRPGGARSRTR